MASRSEFIIFFMTLSFASIFHMAMAGDPDILTDFIVPLGSPVDENLFTFTGMRQLVGAPPPEKFKVLKASMAEFPILNGQSVSMAVLQYSGGSVNPPHTHPRASELLFLLEGSLQVGIVDTTNKLYTQTLQVGDIFVFPKGLVHFQYNVDANNTAFAISAFGSASAGTVSIPSAVFNTSISDAILAKSFKTDVSTIQKLKAGLSH
ncbi:germin-like protein 9-3 [Impatiens glandulifera]|uniref:germin-like protein 9-3 n=1 Tax=Impatiens glandulifera TaxID=253017 RepID=UPI001FB0920B|nr:germin-like protein 9-3 [Impatiens glandulifera]